MLEVHSLVWTYRFVVCCSLGRVVSFFRLVLRYSRRMLRDIYLMHAEILWLKYLMTKTAASWKFWVTWLSCLTGVKWDCCCDRDSHVHASANAVCEISFRGAILCAGFGVHVVQYCFVVIYSAASKESHLNCENWLTLNPKSFGWWCVSFSKYLLY